MPRRLYQFPISHYCEKARWALDVKRLDYEIVNLIPGPHVRTTTKIAPKSHTPILVDDGESVQGSKEIIDYLDKRYPQHRLTPTTTEEASRAHEWERYADRNIGIPLRLYFYYYVLGNRKLSVQLLTEDGPWWGKAFYFFAFPAVRKAMRQAMLINKDNAASAKQKIMTAFDLIEDKIKPGKYLAGPMFSRADLAVSALLAPCWKLTSSDTHYEAPTLPSELREFISELERRELYEWAQTIYKTHRDSPTQA